LLKFSFQHLSIFNIGSGQIPADNASLAVPHGVGAREKPTVLSVFPAANEFLLPKAPTCDSALTQTIVPLQIVSMEALAVIDYYELIQGAAPW
jgi:hypothetical protein